MNNSPLPKIKRYSKKDGHSYSFGVFPTVDLINKKREHILQVLFHPGLKDTDGVSDLKNLCAKYQIPALYSIAAIEKIAKKENTYAVGVFKKYDVPIRKDQNHVVLVNPSNMGNMGTIIRNMVGFNFYDLAIIGPGADIFDPKVVRSSMGAFFRIRFQYFKSIDEYTSVHKNNIYPFMLDGDKELLLTKFKKPFSMVFGNEGEGLPAYYKKLGQSVYIKHSTKIDSLNLATSVGVGLYIAFDRR
ncbi:hypothetical protein A2982_02075 [candidate division WWE3 bacterium RIFCSPLOWO2_01_FULL_39_13]|uniref:tRNA/rRNA methyltransferase SpoU type domain-containing protein n=1 Tax=candidate division WWE3 bacterium RIFCSPLOWO2_01_FULL_39_13 TaxID=1802624 RepID=A0A1F4V523_UNCKA|nr:MAG: hypothetical protein A2982_02075 [candidate division WWE3 bacterium RIFCSPLOWO2_01_FULL_39_13]